MVSVIFAVLGVSFWALTTVVKLPWKFLTLITGLDSCKEMRMTMWKYVWIRGWWTKTSTEGDVKWNNNAKATAQSIWKVSADGNKADSRVSERLLSSVNLVITQSLKLYSNKHLKQSIWYSSLHCCLVFCFSHIQGRLHQRAGVNLYLKLSDVGATGPQNDLLLHIMLTACLFFFAP